MSETEDILGPLEPDTMRVVFLYVGQGEATFVQMPDGDGAHLSMLIDCNRAESLGGVSLPKFLTDVLPKNSSGKPMLDVFLNTHPHSDHLGGLDEIRKEIHVGAVWHSGHKPSSAHKGPYGDLAALLKDVRGRGGREIQLKGSRTPSYGVPERPMSFLQQSTSSRSARARPPNSVTLVFTTNAQ